ncbi:S26 family signal peptidase [Candidatus Daviesbacteria bacterium]|nr:S26 family signal peptidase [Candidatus Daviesbacteria bacterium]
MLPFLNAGQEVLVWGWFCKPKVGDIVVIGKNGKDMIKRIQKVSGRKYFVEGDNKRESTDSRSFGPIDKSEIIGKVVFVVR